MNSSTAGYGWPSKPPARFESRQSHKAYLYPHSIHHKMAELQVGRAAAVAVPIILLLIAAFFTLSYAISTALGFPQNLGFPLVVRALGVIIVVAGLAVVRWVFAYRRPADMIASTYLTFMKLISRIPVAELSGRKEPLIVEGPQKYVRNPLYFGVIVTVFGWGLVDAYTFILVAAVVLLLWYGLILIPFEERELRALFGEQYAAYAANVPMLIPFTKRKKRSSSTIPN